MQRISAYIDRQRVIELAATDKTEALRELMDVVENASLIAEPGAFYEQILEREKQGTTGLGSGVAIPHVRTEALDDIFIAVGRSVGGIDFAAADGGPVHLVFLIGIPVSKAGLYLQLIARISWLVRNEKLRNELFHAPDIDAFFELLNNY